MIKVLFVCLGNICRSPMAEFVFKDMVKRNDVENQFAIESAGTSNEEQGNHIHYGTRQKLESVGIKIDEKLARQLKKEDYNKYDYIIGMEQRNIRDMYKIFGEDSENKVYRLLDFSNNPRDIDDPWYTGNFDITYNNIVEGLECFFKYLEKIGKIEQK